MRPAAYLFLAVICGIGLVERVAATLHGNGLGGSGWAGLSAIVMLIGVVVCVRSFVLARRERGAASAVTPRVTA